MGHYCAGGTEAVMQSIQLHGIQHPVDVFFFFLLNEEAVRGMQKRIAATASLDSSLSGRIWEMLPMSSIGRRTVLPMTCAKCTHSTSMTGKTLKMCFLLKSHVVQSPVVPCEHCASDTGPAQTAARLLSSPVDHTPDTSLQKRTQHSL